MNIITKLRTYHWKRYVYFIGGIAFIAQGIQDKHYWASFIGGYFTIMAIMNIGCASGHCSVPKSNPNKDG